MAVRGQIAATPEATGAAERTLETLLDREERHLATSWPGESPRLRDVFPPLVWRQKRRIALNLAEKFLSGALPRSVDRRRGRSFQASELPANGRWAEVPLATPSLRLHGRADLIERVDGDVVVRDLKTGRVLGSDGNVLPHIERQMRLYGAMARVVWPTATVSLVVDDGVEHDVEFTSERESELLDWLHAILRKLPSDAEVPGELLASPGAGCEGCPHRHVCPAYLRRAPDFWRGKADVRMPLDIWGEVVSVSAGFTGLCDLTMRDAIGRTVKVFGLAAFRLSGVQPGESVWMFGLRTRDKRGGPGSWNHPRNFFEVADDDQYSRAWTLEAFRDQSA